MRFPALLESLGIPVGEKLRDIRVHFGGPVERQRGFVLHSDEVRSPQGTMPIAGGVAMTATRDMLEQIARGEGPRAGVLALGYAGWGRGSSRGSWRATMADRACARRHRLWPRGRVQMGRRAAPDRGRSAGAVLAGRRA